MPAISAKVLPPRLQMRKQGVVRPDPLGLRPASGTHRSVTTPEKPKLADVRQAVENDWRAATVKAREAAAYQALLDGYTIKIAKP